MALHRSPAFVFALQVLFMSSPSAVLAVQTAV
jgi:hypothetical protein